MSYRLYKHKHSESNRPGIHCSYLETTWKFDVTREVGTLSFNQLNVVPEPEIQVPSSRQLQRGGVDSWVIICLQAKQNHLFKVIFKSIITKVILYVHFISEPPCLTSDDLIPLLVRFWAQTVFKNIKLFDSIRTLSCRRVLCSTNDIWSLVYADGVLVLFQVLVISQSNVKHLHSHVYYIDNLHWSMSSKDDLRLEHGTANFYTCLESTLLKLHSLFIK